MEKHQVRTAFFSLMALVAFVLLAVEVIRPAIESAGAAMKENNRQTQAAETARREKLERINTTVRVADFIELTDGTLGLVCNRKRGEARVRYHHQGMEHPVTDDGSVSGAPDVAQRFKRIIAQGDPLYAEAERRYKLNVTMQEAGEQVVAEAERK